MFGESREKNRKDWLFLKRKWKSSEDARTFRIVPIHALPSESDGPPTGKLSAEDLTTRSQLELSIVKYNMSDPENKQGSTTETSAAGDQPAKESSGWGMGIKSVTNLMTGEQKPDEEDLEFWAAAQQKVQMLQDKQENVDQIIIHMASAVQEVYKQIATQGKDAPWWNQLITCRDDKLVITAEGQDDAEEHIRVWLTRLNDICRIASNFCFTKTGTLSEFACIGQSIHGLADQPSPLNCVVEQMFADENLPEVMVSHVSTGLHTIVST